MGELISVLGVCIVGATLLGVASKGRSHTGAMVTQVGVGIIGMVPRVVWVVLGAFLLGVLVGHGG